MDRIIERKFRYNTEIVDYECRLIHMKPNEMVLFHIVEESFTMIANQAQLTIPIGSYTIAYYWDNRPYNLYFWRDEQGEYLGCYFNIVRNTAISSSMVSYDDLIIDVLVLPTGEYFVLDEEELPVPLEEFEQGSVHHDLHSLLASIEVVISEVIMKSRDVYNHHRFVPMLKEYASKSG